MRGNSHYQDGKVVSLVIRGIFLVLQEQCEKHNRDDGLQKRTRVDRGHRYTSLLGKHNQGKRMNLFREMILQSQVQNDLKQRKIGIISKEQLDSCTLQWSKNQNGKWKIK